MAQRREVTCLDPLQELGLELDGSAPSSVPLWARQQILGLCELTGVLLCSFFVSRSFTALDRSEDVWQVSKSRQVLGKHF